MKVAIMQPYFFPYIGYWQLINAADKFVIFDDVNYINKGWINRNRILMKNEIITINLQLSKASQNKLIKEINVLGDTNYNIKLLKTIETCYAKAPYYEKVFPLIKSIVLQEEENLARYLSNSILKVCKYLEIDSEIIISSEINKSSDLKGQNKIIEICKHLRADAYINAIGGQALYNPEEFILNNIDLRFIKTNEIHYDQNREGFNPNLSIIDVMMFNTPETIQKMLDQYSLI